MPSVNDVHAICVFFHDVDDTVLHPLDTSTNTYWHFVQFFMHRAADMSNPLISLVSCLVVSYSFKVRCTGRYLRRAKAVQTVTGHI